MQTIHEQPSYSHPTRKIALKLYQTTKIHFKKPPVSKLSYFKEQRYHPPMPAYFDAISRDFCSTWHPGGLFVSFHLNPRWARQFDNFHHEPPFLTSSTISQNGCYLESRRLNVRLLTLIQQFALICRSQSLTGGTLDLENSYNKYLAVAARAVRRSLKDTQRLNAERRGQSDLKFAKWEVSHIHWGISGFESGWMELTVADRTESRVKSSSSLTPTPKHRLLTPKNKRWKSMIRVRLE